MRIYRYSITKKVLTSFTESCTLGYSGPKCALCQSDAACSLATDDESATCSTDLNFQENSTLKTFACNPLGPPLIADLIVPDSLTIQCHTRPGEETSGTNSPAPSTPSPAVIASTPVAAPSLGVPAPGPSTLPLAPVPAPTKAPLIVPPILAPGTEGGRAPAPAPGIIIGGVDIGGLLNDAGNAIGGGGAGRRLMQAAPAPEGSTASPYCDVGFRVKNPAIEITCRANECGLQP